LVKRDICVSEKDLYICVTYIPPEDSTVYTTVYSDLYDFDFFEQISDDVRSQCDQGDVFITGNSNIRTSDRPDYVENINIHRYVTMPGIEEYIVPSNRRRSGCSLVDYLIMNHDLFLFH